MASDEHGRPVRLLLTCGQVHDITQAKPLLRGLKARAVIADKGYVSKDLRRYLQRKSIKPVIPPRDNAKRPTKYSKYLYKKRNNVERGFNKLKHFRRLATRYDRNDQHYMATVTLASIHIWLRNLYVDSA